MIFSFLVCSKYEEAASLASLVIKRIQHDNVFAHDAVNGIELLDMIESAGMVLVQSLNQLGRYYPCHLHLLSLYFLANISTHIYACIYIYLYYFFLQYDSKYCKLLRFAALILRGTGYFCAFL